jgi:phenylacetate-CoA ligase
MAVIRFAEKGKAEFPGIALPNWGASTIPVIDTGPLVMLNSSADISLQAKFLTREQPEYLFSYPSNLKALAKYFISNGLQLEKLREVRTLGEILDDEMKSVCRKAWGVVDLIDVYSAQELGYIALQCPENENIYHIQAENLYVEVLDKEGYPCKEGEIGRIVVTTLHNFAMPLIRYEIGDYAEVGSSCACGRTLPVLRQIMGRKRNMLALPNGEKRWPSLGASIWASELPMIKQFKFIQKSTELIEVYLVVERQLTKDEEGRFMGVVQDELRYPFNIEIKYLENIPRSKGGKFEDFVSEVA